MSQRSTAHDPKPDQEGSNQFGRFEQLTRRLLAVPKKEADSKAAERKRNKDKSR